MILLRGDVMKNIMKHLLTIFLLMIIFSGCSDQKEEKTMYLNLPKEEITAFEMLPNRLPRCNGAKTTEKKLINEIVDQLNQIEYRYRGTEKEAMLGYGLNCEFVITFLDGSKQEYRIDGKEIQFPDGTWWETTAWNPDANYFADLLGIKRYAERGRIWEPDKTGIKLEFVSLTPGSGSGMTEDREQIEEILEKLNMYGYYECQGYIYDYDEPEGYFAVTCEDGSVLKYEFTGYFVHCPDGKWLEGMDHSFQILHYLSQKLGFEYKEPAAG